MDSKLTQPFLNSVKEIIKQMTAIEVETKGVFYPENEDLISYGVSTIVTFTGKIKGRLLLDMEPDLAIHIARITNRENYQSVKELMVLASISELNNIVAGDANTYLNNQYHLKLRLAPPIVFSGEKAVICIPKIGSESVDCTTMYGKLKVNIAFEGGV